jgi:hypothetical protein
VLAEFGKKQNIPYMLLSDIDSNVIKSYGILNDQVVPEDGFFYGIPYPGVYVTDEDGKVVAKYFHGTYKKRDSAEMLIAAATGDIAIDEEAPVAVGGDEDIKLTATIHGGSGNLRQGIVREILVRFELAEGLHIYGAPVPDGMVATEVTVDGPPGLIVEAPVLPPTEPLTLAGTGVTLQVWSGVVDIRVPIYAASELATEVAPLDRESVSVEVTVRYQACDHETCLLPSTEKFTLEAALDVTEVPAIPIHQGHGQREGNYDGTPHWKRLLERKPPSRRPI